MALFKILKGNKAKLPTTYTEGWMYVTEDTADMYIDMAGEKKQLNANQANYLRDSNNTLLNIGNANKPVYFLNGVPVECGTISNSTTGNAATATKFASTQTITLTGDVTGTKSSQAGWSITTTLKDSGVVANSYGPSANATPGNGGTFKVPYITVDAKGRITAASTKTITLPSYSLSSFGITATAAELNKLDGVTATTAELNKLDGVTATTAELNYTDGVTSNIQTQLNGKAASSHTHTKGTINSVYETRINWGGEAQSGNVSPVGASLSAEHSANRLAYLNPKALSFEYSNNGGSSWTAMSVADSTKIGFVTTSATIYVGNASTVTTNHRTRVTLTAQNGTNGYVYTRPRKLLLNVSTVGHGLQVTLETKTGASGASWTTVGTYELSGWSGWNDIPLSFSTLGGGTTQTSNIWYMRLTFATTSVNSSYTTSKSSIISMRLFGDTCWTRTSNMGETGHLYSYDTSQNATFPAQVTATTFSGSLSGNAATATTATNATKIKSSPSTSKAYVLGTTTTGSGTNKATVYNASVYTSGSVLYGAAWNDYAEYRETKENIKAGHVVVETGNGDLKLSSKRLEPGANIVTDTFGFAIGQTEICGTPIAVCGRVLAYPYEDISEFAPGDPVCAGPNGTISLMSRVEVQEYPDRMIGTVSEIPTYEYWKDGAIKVDGRIWIKVL